jgi:hypothetical protein
MVESAMGCGRASAGPTSNIGLAARAFSASAKTAPAEAEGDDRIDGVEVVTGGKPEGRPPGPLPGPVPARTDQTKMTNPNKIETARMSTPARTTHPLARADRISPDRINMMAMAHTAPKPLRNAYRPT